MFLGKRADCLGRLIVPCCCFAGLNLTSYFLGAPWDATRKPERWVLREDLGAADLGRWWIVPPAIAQVDPVLREQAIEQYNREFAEKK